jgi:paraquat-inducible protein B
MGQKISITFKTAAGLEAGKTKIKYKNVEIGEVKSIHINHETEDVTDSPCIGSLIYFLHIIPD